MRVCYLANAGSVHVERWTRYFAEKGDEVTVLSLTPAEIEGVRVVHLRVPSGVGRWSYLLAIPQIKRLIRQLNPDVVHAHYVSSYGLLGMLANCRPLVVSAWGSDVCRFPRTSPLHAALIRSVLARCDRVCATSRFLATEVRRYTEREDIDITPFGIDCHRFVPAHRSSVRSPVVIGTVRNLEHIYGIDVLIAAFAAALKRVPELLLMIVGDGTERDRLERLVRKFGIEHRIRFTGHAGHERIPGLLADMDIFVIPSLDREAFGVAALEASASNLPVIASKTGGLEEVVEDGVTGVMVPPGDVGALTDAIVRLSEDHGLRASLGMQGTLLVHRLYEWGDTAARMASLYEAVALAGSSCTHQSSTRVSHP